MPDPDPGHLGHSDKVNRPSGAPAPPHMMPDCSAYPAAGWGIGFSGDPRTSLQPAGPRLLRAGVTCPDVFGAVHLGYVAIETQCFADWRRFGADAIDLHVDELTRDTTRFPRG